MDGANFLQRFFVSSSFERKSKYLTINLMHPNTTAGLICDNLGIILSIILKLTNLIHFSFNSILWSVFTKKIQDKHLCPFHTLINSNQDSTQKSRINTDMLFPTEKRYLLQRCDGICKN